MLSNLKKFRLISEMSLQDISNKIGMSKQYISKVELKKTKGSCRFWDALMKAYKLSENDINFLQEE